MGRGICVLLVLVGLAISFANAQIVTLYTNTGQTGGACPLSASSADLAATCPLVSYSAESLQFFTSNYYVDIFDGLSWTGIGRRLRSSTLYNIPTLNPYIRNAAGATWMNAIKSVRLTPIPVGVAGAIIFDANGYLGNSIYQEGPANYPDLNLVGMAYNADRSIIIFEYTLVYLYGATGGVNNCPDESCAVANWFAGSTPLAVTGLAANAKSINVLQFQTPTTTTAAATTAATSTTAAATTASVASTNAATTTARAVTSTFAVTTIHAAVLAGVANSGAQRRNATESGGTGRSR